MNLIKNYTKNMDLLSPLPINLSTEDYNDFMSQINEASLLICNKYLELSTIKMFNHLKSNAINYNIIIEFKHDTTNGFYYHTIQCLGSNNERNNQLEVELRKNLVIPEHYLQKLYKKDKKVEFINNAENRDKIIEFMIGDKWQQWKKEAEIVAQHESLSQKIPEKPHTKEQKKKI